MKILAKTRISAATVKSLADKLKEDVYYGIIDTEYLLDICIKVYAAICKNIEISLRNVGSSSLESYYDYLLQLDEFTEDDLSALKKEKDIVCNVMAALKQEDANTLVYLAKHKKELKIFFEMFKNNTGFKEINYKELEYYCKQLYKDFSIEDEDLGPAYARMYLCACLDTFAKIKNAKDLLNACLGNNLKFLQLVKNQESLYNEKFVKAVINHLLVKRIKI